jgi:chromosomal replication initiation ATPase DnaA
LEQLVFPLKKATQYSPADFVSTPSNHLAHSYVASWPAWPILGGIVFGPSHSGKTHLCHVWQKKANAQWLTLKTIEAIDFETLGDASFIIDDIDALLPNYETMLFHLFNHLKSHKGFLLITSKHAPKTWDIKLKDLVSRFSSLPAFEIQDPDDTLFLVMLTKGFSDYQLHVPAKVLDFILKKIPRTFDSLKNIPEQLSDASLRDHCNITIPFVKETLGL